MEGGCNCRHVRYRLGADPIVVNCCHCRMCQRSSGSAFSLNVMIEAAHLEQTGAGRAEVFVPSPGDPIAQPSARCPRCATILWGHHADFGDSLCFIRAGTLDFSREIRPTAHFFTITKHPWIALPDDLPCYEGLPGPGVEPPWGKEGQRRIDAVLARRATVTGTHEPIAAATPKE
jgi:hypothetical protein